MLNANNHIATRRYTRSSVVTMTVQAGHGTPILTPPAPCGHVLDRGAYLNTLAALGRCWA